MTVPDKLCPQDRHLWDEEGYCVMCGMDSWELEKLK